MCCGFRREGPHRPQGCLLPVQLEILLCLCLLRSVGTHIASKGLALIGDGMHFVKVLQLLHAELQDGSREESSLSGRLLDCRQNGIYVDHVVFPEQDRLHRIIWYTHCHDEEENKFKSSSLFDKMSLIHTMKVQAAGGSLDEVNAKLIKVLGPGSRSKVQKWTRLYLDYMIPFEMPCSDMNVFRMDICSTTHIFADTVPSHLGV